jgi:hypothetical protein
MNSEISTVLSAVPPCQKKKKTGLRGCIYNYRAFRNEETIIIQQENRRGKNCFLLNRDVLLYTTLFQRHGLCDAE